MAFSRVETFNRATTALPDETNRESPPSEPVPSEQNFPAPENPLTRILLRIGAWQSLIVGSIVITWLLSAFLLPPHKVTDAGVTTVTYPRGIGVAGLALAVVSAAALWYLARQPHELVIQTVHQGRVQTHRASHTYIYAAVLGALILGFYLIHRVTVDDRELWYLSLIEAGRIPFDDLQQVSYEEQISHHKGRTSRTYKFKFHFKSGMSGTTTLGPLLGRALPELMTQLERRGLQVADHTEHGAFARVWDPVISRLPEDQQAAARQAKQQAEAPPPEPTAAEKQAAFKQYEQQLLEERLKGLAGTRWISGNFASSGFYGFSTVALDFASDDALILTHVRQSARPDVPQQQTEYRLQSTRQGGRFTWKCDDDSELIAKPQFFSSNQLKFEPLPPTPKGKAALVAKFVTHSFRPAP